MSDKQNNSDKIEPDVFFPEQESFKFLLIKTKDISMIRYDDPEYKKIICNLDIYEEVETTSNDFFDVMIDKLGVEMLKSRNKPFGLNTQLVGSTPTHMIELIHIDLMPKDTPVEIYNGVANMLKMDKQHIFGNSILIKTEVPLDSDFVKMVDCSRTDLHDLMDNRVRHIGVSVDDDNETTEINWYYEDPSKLIEEFMTQEHKFIERGFLKHNLQIYYTPGKKDDLERLIDAKYDQIIILTKLTDYFYGNFTLKEFNDIKILLENGCPLNIPDEWEDEIKLKTEEMKGKRRNYVFNKYKALWKGKKEYLNKENKNVENL